MQTIGERLEEARKKKGVSIREAAEATKIRGDYLQKFESNHFDIGLTEIYTRGFLRTYANFLKLPSDRIINDYAALGRGEVRPRQPNREVYGRMDISVASTPENSGSAPAENPPAKSPPNQGPAQPHYPKTGSSLPTGPDPATIFKYVKWGGAGVIGILALLLIWSFFSSRPGSSSDAKNPVATSSSARTPTFGLEALGPVTITVHRANPDGTDGELLFTGTMAAGERRTVSRPGPVFIEASLAQNIQIVLNGRPHNLGDILGTGKRRGELPAP